MPLYEYSCEGGNVFEQMKSFSQSDEPTACPKCKKQAVRAISQGITGRGPAEPWHYDYTKKMKPKFVKDHKGNRIKYDPTKHTSGEGRGRRK